MLLSRRCNGAPWDNFCVFSVISCPTVVPRILAVRVVDSLDEAIAHIRQYGSDHTEVIATRNEAHAEKFVHALRSAVVMVNASSRFSDGGELGLGAEIGISTTRLHAYGPMGLEALTVERFVVRGSGQTRNLP